MEETTILLPSESRARLVEALIEAGAYETGGILMGRSLGSGAFRVEDLTIQRGRGRVAFFLRQVTGFLRPLHRFFERTRHQYTEYNYLGEWHSHPSFALRPSGKDEASMREIVEDPDVGALFAVLLIVKLVGRELSGRAFVFMPGVAVVEARLVLEQGSEG